MQASPLLLTEPRQTPPKIRSRQGETTGEDARPTMWRPAAHCARRNTIVLVLVLVRLTTNLHSVPPFVSSALQSMKILFSCEDFSQKSFASLINRARARPDFARPTSRPTPRCFFTPGQGAPKRSDGGVVLVLGELSSPTYSVFGWWA